MGVPSAGALAGAGGSGREDAVLAPRTVGDACVEGGSGAGAVELLDGAAAVSSQSARWLYSTARSWGWLYRIQLSLWPSTLQYASTTHCWKRRPPR